MNENRLWSKTSLVESIQSSHLDFLQTVSELPQDVFEFSWNGKWTPGQHLVHIDKSISPVFLAFRLPRFVPRYKFGLANRPSRTYEQVVAKYQKALKGLTHAAPKEFVPRPVLYTQRGLVFSHFEKSMRRLTSSVGKCSENTLDRYVLPHPLIGKLTFREIIFFSIYHARHHHQIVNEIIKNSP